MGRGAAGPCADIFFIESLPFLYHFLRVFIYLGHGKIKEDSREVGDERTQAVPENNAGRISGGGGFVRLLLFFLSSSSGGGAKNHPSQRHEEGESGP
jgi:hypothetical protein